MNIKQYIKNKIAEYDSSIDVGDGSPLGDLLVNPLGTILQPLVDFENYVSNNLSLENVNNMSEDELDAIAYNFLLKRIEGNKAIGSVRLFYNLPTSVNLPAGTLFKNNEGKVYKTINTFSITKEAMLQNNEYYPQYHTGDIAIEATDFGEDYITGAGTINTLVSSISPYPAKIKNMVAITNGTERESNVALYNRILTSFNNKSVASTDGISRVLKESFPSITSIEIKSNGDTEMVRDITYSGSQLGIYHTSDFYAKISGLYQYPYNQSVAYTGRFQDTDDSTEIALPDPDDFTYEFTNDMYKGLYFVNDPDYAELGIYNILEENFNESETATGYKLTWTASDGKLGKGMLNRPSEIVVDNQAIKLGIHEEQSDYTSPEYTGAKVYIDKDILVNTATKLLKLISEAGIDFTDEFDIFR